MQVNTFPPAVLAVMLSACAAEPVLLNSERIEKRFGSYGIDVLASEAGLRRSSLFSLENGAPTCRTYAVVRFAEQLDDRYRDAHTKVLAGNSIGAIFRSHGWDLHKQTMHIGSLAVPPKGAGISELMRLSTAENLALHVYQLLLVRNERVFDYATIMETHHPDYLSESDLHDLYEYDITNALLPHSVSELATLVLGNQK